MPKDELYDVGESRRNPEEPISAADSSVHYPGLTINDTILPTLKGAQTGDVIKLEIEVRVTGTREPEDWDSIQKGTYVTMDIKKMGEPTK